MTKNQWKNFPRFYTFKNRIRKEMLFENIFVIMFNAYIIVPQVLIKMASLKKKHNNI